ncbi:4-oxalomesaconate tautomerase, partial [Alphaproteobacteria bacterium]|nr:4-oxalomesaconate tautomerase [Alphaproteobacteria bacterium]
MNDLRSIPAYLMRGGTSKGLIFHKKDLPSDRNLLTEYLLKIMGSPDVRQINGLGGGTSVTSKVCIISKSLEKDVDIDYFFAQVEVDRNYVDYAPTCGNMLSALGPFAIEEGLVETSNEITKVNVKSINTNALITLDVPTPHGKLKYSGNFKIDGVPGTGSQILMNFKNLEGKSTGNLFPTGNTIDTFDGINVTCFDLATTMIICDAKEFNILGNENSKELNNNKKLLDRIEQIRLLAGKKMEMGDVNGKVLPKVSLLSKSINKNSIVSRYFTPYSCHETHAVTGTCCVASSCLIPGTIGFNLLKNNKDLDLKSEIIKIEHPVGTIDCTIVLNPNFKNNLISKKDLIKSCGIYRTSRI